MRIRQIKPGFWRDSHIAALPVGTRLFYIGLWQIADDAGWLLWDPCEVASDLYPYDGRKLRERRVAEMLDELRKAERVILHDCGHAEIPTLPTHQRVGGRPVYTVRDAHRKDCAQMRADAPGCARQVATERNGRERGTELEQVGNGTEREGTVDARETRDEETNDPADLSEFARKLAKARGMR